MKRTIAVVACMMVFMQVSMANWAQSYFLGQTKTMAEIASAPTIRGTWYFVNPQSGSNNNSGKNLAEALADVQTAYGKCTDGNGDGIMVYSGGTSAAHTSSYLADTLSWTKSAITVFGVCAPTRYAQRARIVSHGTTGKNLKYIIRVSGSNNSFYNVSIQNFGKRGDALNALIVSGSRNYFENCHFYCAGDSMAKDSLEINSLTIAGGSENTFVNCVIGSHTIVRANAGAVGELHIAANSYRNVFEDCTVIMATETAAHGAIKTTGNLNSYQMLRNCDFIAHKPSSAPQALTVLVVGTKPETGGILLRNPLICGWAALADAAWDRVATNGPSANAAGGVVTHP